MGVGALDLALNFRQDQVVFAHSKADVCAKVGGKKALFKKLMCVLRVKVGGVYICGSAD